MFPTNELFVTTTVAPVSTKRPAAGSAPLPRKVVQRRIQSHRDRETAAEEMASVLRNPAASDAQIATPIAEPATASASFRSKSLSAMITVPPRFRRPAPAISRVAGEGALGNRDDAATIEETCSRTAAITADDTVSDRHDTLVEEAGAPHCSKEAVPLLMVTPRSVN